MLAMLASGMRHTASSVLLCEFTPLAFSYSVYLCVYPLHQHLS